MRRGSTVAEKAKAPAGNKAAMQPYFFWVFLGGQKFRRGSSHQDHQSSVLDIFKGVPPRNKASKKAYQPNSHEIAQFWRSLALTRQSRPQDCLLSQAKILKEKCLWCSCMVTKLKAHRPHEPQMFLNHCVYIFFGPHRSSSFTLHTLTNVWETNIRFVRSNCTRKRNSTHAQ